MKKLFTLIVAICATTLAWAVEAEDYYGFCGSYVHDMYYDMEFYFESSTGTLTISGTGYMEDYEEDSYTAPWYDFRSSIKKVVIENGVTSIGDYAFYDCTGLTSITIPNSVTSIGSYAFSGCTGLTSIEIPNSVTSIDYSAFYGCNNIETADINSQVAFNAIDFNDKLTSITIGNSVKSIGEWDFYDCTGLTSINVAEDNLNYASIDGVLYSKDKKTLITCPQGKTGGITIPNSVTSIGSQAFYGCTGLTNINVAEDNLNYASIDGVLYSKDKKALIECPQGKTGSVTIPNSVSSIGYQAFYGCTGLTSVTIGNSVTSIGSSAFSDCTGLTSITIPNSVTSIGSWAFRGCTGLTSMTVEATNPPLASDQYGNGLEMSNYYIPLNVPAGSVDAYKAADEWKKFYYIQAIPATGVNEATVENTVEKSEVKKIIDRNGIIYIEKDGTRYFLNG
ncbi:MAG: leucine-rich repeat domain-containing protein, partial [Paludibacteraceae bacterium]|nr:leucine-rich repeat domain-containing protein [Paludibacteraceae bacterium]